VHLFCYLPCLCILTDKDSSGNIRKKRFSVDSTKSSDTSKSSNEISTPHLPHPHSTHSSSLQTNISSNVQPTDSENLDPTQSSSIYVGSSRTRLSLPTEVGGSKDDIFSVISSTRSKLLQPPHKSQKRAAKSEECMTSKKESFERIEQSSYTSDSFRGFVFPQRSRAMVETGMRTSKISQLIEDQSLMVSMNLALGALC